eukprot:scaffold79525_cov30-Phaeocystis_antarctica.AAC.1
MEEDVSDPGSMCLVFSTDEITSTPCRHHRLSPATNSTPLLYPHHHPHHHRPRHRRVPGAARAKAVSPGGSSPRQQPAFGVQGSIPRAGPGG